MRLNIVAGVEARKEHRAYMAPVAEIGLSVDGICTEGLKKYARALVYYRVSLFRCCVAFIATSMS